MSRASAADHRAVEERLARSAARHLDGDASAGPTCGRSEQASSASSGGSIGATRPGHVRRERALGRAAVERRAGRDEVRDVRDVHPGADPVALAPERERVVEVLRRLGVDRERRAGRAGRRGPRAAARAASCGSNSAPRALLDEQRLEHVLDPVGAARARARPARGRGRCGRRRGRRRRRRRAPCGRATTGTPGVEVRLADDELAAPRDLDDEVRPQLGWRPSDLEEAAQRQPGAERRRGSEARSPSRISAVSGNASACTSGSLVERVCRGSPAARSPCRASRKTTASSDAAEPAEQALDHERAADEPVRRADELHHLDLTPPREDREPDRVRDQQRRRRRAGSTRRDR